ncbi:Os05g0252250, partial [Oryza sativa Japonica Group]
GGLHGGLPVGALGGGVGEADAQQVAVLEADEQPRPLAEVAEHGVPDHLDVAAAPGAQRGVVGVDAEHEAVVAVDAPLAHPRRAREQVGRRLRFST